MSPSAELQGDYLVKSRDDLRATLESRLLTVLPNAYTGNDSIFKLLLEIFASQLENSFVANQLVLEDLFIQSSSINALEKFGRQFGVPRKTGNEAEGNVTFAGVGGTFVPEGTSLSTENPLGDPLFFITTADATLPNPGIPTAPSAAEGTGGAVSGSLTYLVTFYTALGETAGGPASNTVSVTSKRIDLSSIPLGGTGTVGRHIYRDKDGGGFKRIATIADNTTTIFEDNDNGAGTSDVPVVSNAESISSAVISEDAGEEYNVSSGEIIVLVDAPTGITSVNNPSPFSGGTDPEDMEDYRVRMLEFVASPKSGSTVDLEIWAEEIEGVETASAFSNDNVGTPTNGHATVRISGPDGAIPSGAVQDEVLAHLESKDFANIALHVATFTPVSRAVTITVTLQPGFVLGDVQVPAQNAIKKYINDLGVGETLYLAGIFDAVFGLPGIATLTISVPSADQTHTSVQKPVPGTITVGT